MNKPNELAVRIVAELQETYKIGNVADAMFCDAPYRFDSATDEELVTIITKHLAPLLARNTLLEEVAKAAEIVASMEPYSVDCHCRFCKLRTTIVALNQIKEGK